MPLPPSQLLLADEDPPPDPPPEEMWYFDHSESMMSISLQNSTGSVPPGSNVTMQAYVENTYWEIWTSSFGNVQTMNYSSGPASYTGVSWYQDSGDGYLTNFASSTDSMGTAASDFVMGSSQAVVRVEVGDGNGGIASATLTLDPSITEETWSWSYSGSTITSVQWQDSAGATLGNGEQQTLTVTVSQDWYDVWNSSWGNSLSSVTSSGIAANVPVTFSIQSGDGLLNYSSSATTWTDGMGQASVTFIMGSNDTVVGVMAGDASQYPLYGPNVGFTASTTGGGDTGGGDTGGGDTGGGDTGGETWSLAGTESSYAISMMADGGVTELPQGSQLGAFTAWVTTTTHDVYQSNWGNTYYGADSTASASDVPVWFMVEGDSSPFATTTTDGTGSCYGSTSTGGSYTSVMGSSPVHIWAYVMDGGQNVLASTCWDISPVSEQWSYFYDETTIVASLSTDAAQTDVPAGTSCPVSVNVTYSNWEVWQSSLGSFELRNYTTGAAEGASVWFSLESGDGTVDTTSISTDAQGQATATFTMGQDASVLRVDSWFLTASSAASLNFIPPAIDVEPVWNYDHQESSLDVLMGHEPGSNVVSAQVSYVTWDVYVLSTDSTQTENRNLTSSPAGAAQVSFSIGTGTVDNDLTYTDGNGDASTTYQTTTTTTVTAYASVGGGMTQTGTITVEASGGSGGSGQSQALSITTNSLPSGTVGSDYSALILASGGTAPYTFNQITGSGDTLLPFGYQLLSNGMVTGSGDNSTGSQQAGSYTFTVEVADSATPCHTVQKQLTLSLEAAQVTPFGFASLYLPQATAGWGYNTHIPISGGVGTVTFSATGLPEWLSLSADGTLSGTPPYTTTTCSFMVQAQDEYYDPNIALNRTISTSFTLLVQEPSSVNVTITSGNQQIIPVGSIPAPVGVSVTVDGAAAEGVELALGSVSAVTGSNGIALFDLPSFTTQGERSFTVSTPAGDGPTIQLYTYEPPEGSVGSSPEILPGAPETPTVTAVENDEVIVESRWVSTSSGTLDAHYSPGVAMSYVGGVLHTYLEPWGGPDYSSNGTSWKTSNGQSGTDSPPDLDSLPWTPGLAGGYDAKYPDTNNGPVAWPDGVTSGGRSQSWYNYPGAVLIWAGGYFGKSKDRQKHVTSQVRIRRKTAAEGADAVTMTFVDVTKKKDAAGVESIVNCNMQTMSIAQNQSESTPAMLSPSAQVGEANEEGLRPVEAAPEVLAVNTNFDESDVDTSTHFAKPDCSNSTLKAKKNHLDGNWQAGDIVTDDLHQGFFGLRPGILPYSETAGSVVKIKKLDKNDPETNHKQSGHVCLYAVWGSLGSEEEMKIDLYNKDTLVANDLGPQLYHQNPNMPVTFYIEGVEPGKITLEFSYQKGSNNLKYEQEFLVATHQPKDKWLKEIRYQLLLQTNGNVDLDHYLPNDGGWRPRQDPASGSRSFVWHADRVKAIYDYYGQLFEQWPEKLDWMGAARMVGGAVYGGLCDLQASTPSFSVMDELMGGQILIYRDLAWQHRAYVASGIWALEWVDEHDSGSVNGIDGQVACELEAWRDFHASITSNSWPGIKTMSRLLVRREQEEVIAPMWAAIMNTASGFATIASGEAKNPVDPDSPTFPQVVPGGSVANYPDRDRFSFGWTNSPKGVFPVWWGETESSGTPEEFYGASTRLGLVRIPLRTRAALFAQFGTIY